MRLGRRQLDVLCAANLGRANARHSGRGMFSVSGLTDSYGDDVLDRLLALGLVTPGEELIAGYRLALTDDGRAELAARGLIPPLKEQKRSCPDDGACHHGCTGSDCFRVRCCGPLSDVFPNDDWPPEIVSAVGAVTSTGHL